ncbi:hypothetical protein DA803_01440 [[Mycoplasma] phocae]|uniref:Uncharacterized protein n=1 Tax=[Mycoplasma] phocae TaxID=142651 RepID=A0A2Z5ISK0_9BACT|nr:hypothetical protein [[Mycoplasma] phocae]AXE60748.1 hypothetical protein DA803_01440 [[Mycoplasma] phocae]
MIKILEKFKKMNPFKVLIDYGFNDIDIDLDDVCFTNKKQMYTYKKMFKKIYSDLLITFEESLPEDIRELYVKLFKTKDGFTKTNWKDFYVSKATFYRKINKLFIALSWIFC